MNKVVLNRDCFKICKNNAKAMIEGFEKNGKLIHQCIYCEVKNKQFPKLITLNKGNTRFTLSEIGKQLDAGFYSIPYKYIASLEKEYFINYNSKIWEKICNNGLFDIWEPEAPHNRFGESELNSNQFRILLLRIYEIEEEFNKSEVREGGARHHIITRNNLNVTIKRPIISDEEFNRIKELLEESIKEYQTGSSTLFLE